MLGLEYQATSDYGAARLVISPLTGLDERHSHLRKALAG